LDLIPAQGWADEASQSSHGFWLFSLSHGAAEIWNGRIKVTPGLLHLALLRKPGRDAGAIRKQFRRRADWRSKAVGCPTLFEKIIGLAPGPPLRSIPEENPWSPRGSVYYNERPPWHPEPCRPKVPEYVKYLFTGLSDFEPAVPPARRASMSFEWSKPWNRCADSSGLASEPCELGKVPSSLVKVAIW